MSRIGKQPIEIPSGITVNISGRKVTVQGPKGNLEMKLRNGIDAKVEDNQVVCSLKGATSEKKNFGLCRSLISNMIEGCEKGFKKELEVIGVGYRANVQGNVLDLALGFSHPIKYNIPQGLTITADKSGKITIEGPDKQLVGQSAAEIRSYREPEPYKGKGVKYSDERVVRKAGKTGAK